MAELTPGQIVLLHTEVIGPAPGWNADLEVRLHSAIVTGAEAADLLLRGLMEAVPIHPPYEEEFDENAGSIVLDHIWKPTEAGRAALSISDSASVIARPAHP
ncbi:hypothetical protein AB7783_26505 [Tardiphaga sp. 172_B4_N1_3]|uniref:hypothetical protein n=1 Tax=Tardiphaga sp. 172_B4_N1_3 TaxID=3240787 RepID=UPI003F8AC67B